MLAARLSYRLGAGQQWCWLTCQGVLIINAFQECMIGYATTRVFRSRAVTCTACTNPGCARCDTAGNW